MKIYFNGKEYNSIDEVPEEFRHFLKDENKNGLPDFVENIFGQNLAGAMNNATFQKFVFKDKIFDKLEQLPPEEQRKVREKLEKLNSLFTPHTQDQNPGAIDPQNISTPLSQNTAPNLQQMLGDSYSPVKSSSSKPILLLMAVIGIFIAVIAAGLLLFLSAK